MNLHLQCRTNYTFQNDTQKSDHTIRGPTLITYPCHLSIKVTQASLQGTLSLGKWGRVEL